MELDKCIFCRAELEEHGLGSISRRDDACEDLPLCKSCLKLLKKEMDKVKEEE